MTDRNWPQCFREDKTLLLSIALTLLQSCTSVQADENQTTTDSLGFNFLQGNAPLESPRVTKAFTPPNRLVPASNKFEGLLTLLSAGAVSHIEILEDTFNLIADKSLKAAELPALSVRLVSDGTNLIPLDREPQRTNHPNWELIVEPGKTWDTIGDNGWSRAVLPFTLKERNENCLHNGLMTFLFRSDGSSSRAAWQITSETCLYVKINLWGTIETQYEPQTISSSGEAIVAYSEEIASRLPVRSLSELGADYPGLDQAAFQPPGNNNATVYGLVIDGVHYRSDCPTRYGPNPFCETLSLPSYSLAKSMFGSLAYQLLIDRWPEFAAIPVSDLIPECNTPDHRWDDVLPVHLLDMTTGNYDSQEINRDDNADKMLTFFEAEDHDGKVRFSCAAWPRRSKPGTEWAYHTSDTYLLGVAMNTFLRQKLGPQADIYRDIVHSQVLQQLNLSPLLQWTQRTYDDTAQPFTGYGLVMNADDIARLAQALNSDGTIGRYLSGIEFGRSVAHSNDSTKTMHDARNTAYMNGFWAIDASGWMTCQDGTWIPFMSGYGGISVAMFPGGGVYYFFTDSGKHGLRHAAAEANKALNYCKE